MENIQKEQSALENLENNASIDSCQDANVIEKANSADSYGRFKSGDELLKAYTNLEKEFTKRSQRLKALEKEIDNKATPTPEYKQENWQQRVDDFLDKNPSAVPFKKELSRTILDSDLSTNPNCLELALAKVLIKNYKTPTSLIEDTDFLDNHIYSNDKIRGKIIKDYLCKVSNVRSPKTIGGGGQPVLTPPTRPKNFDEAGKMAVKLNHGAK